MQLKPRIELAFFANQPRVEVRPKRARATKASAIEPAGTPGRPMPEHREGAEEKPEEKPKQTT